MHALWWSIGVQMKVQMDEKVDWWIVNRMNDWIEWAITMNITSSIRSQFTQQCTVHACAWPNFDALASESLATSNHKSIDSQWINYYNQQINRHTRPMAIELRHANELLNAFQFKHEAVKLKLFFQCLHHTLVSGTIVDVIKACGLLTDNE